MWNAYVICIYCWAYSAPIGRLLSQKRPRSCSKAPRTPSIYLYATKLCYGVGGWEQRSDQSVFLIESTRLMEETGGGTTYLIPRSPGVTVTSLAPPIAPSQAGSITVCCQNSVEPPFSWSTTHDPRWSSLLHVRRIVLLQAREELQRAIMEDVY